ncbi:Small heat shock protein [Granulibacter bethesdensis]|uniref:Small heat shock protein n=2 Tax=Granulibacter bethesdensis TaxID=364410 RepID=A0AAC9KEH9_9PROT|nr:Small heat shock protein [Granulibacter bethesdensis]APH62246.1 Small heat shock protein [Granulibacter bethesdensis]
MPLMGSRCHSGTGLMAVQICNLALQEVVMNSFDFAPLFRSAIGFDRLARLANTVSGSADVSSYPPYNIEKLSEDSYRLTMAVAGFEPTDLDVTVKDNALVVSGHLSNEQKESEVLYRGIAGRAFERRFVLADHMVVDSADLKNGLLHIGLKRIVPESAKPRKIEIGTSTEQQVLTQSVAQDNATHNQNEQAA